MRAVLSIAVALVACIAPASAADLDLSYCTVCHGARGNGNLAIRAPKIAGMEPWYLRRQLQAFRAGWRGSHPDDAAGNEMRPMAARLSDDAMIAQTIAHVASFPEQMPPVTVSGNVAHGKQLYQACAPCHGARAEGNEAMYAPALAGRTDWYLTAQLRNYMNGLRGTHAQDTYGLQMRAAVSALPNRQAADDVVAYINTLR